jgi:hypothetical protein
MQLPSRSQSLRRLAACWVSSAFFTPNPLYALMVDLNALVPEHVRNHPIPRATVSGGQLYDLCADLILVCALDHPIPYGGSIHP